MNLIPWVRARFGKIAVQRAPHTDPLRPDFDINAWLREGIELEKQNPDPIDRFAPTGPAALLGFSDHVTPKEKAEQESRLAEWKRQQEEAKRAPSTPQHKAS